MRNYENGSRQADKFVIRLPDGLRADVEQEASQADRSMNAVMVQAVKEYLNGRQRKKALIDTLEQAAKAQGDFNIGDHARMAIDARRYQFLRDELFRHGLSTTIPTGSALDKFTDEALRSFDALNPLPLSQAASGVAQGETDKEWGCLTPETASALGAIANPHLDSASASTDPRDLFITANPMGTSQTELEKSKSGFVDDRTHGDWLIFKAGFEAALEAER